MSEEIKETLDDVKRHLDYVEATKRSSTRDNEMKEMYEYITSLQQKVEQLENIRKEAIEYIEGFYYPDERQLTHEFDGWNLAKLYDILNKGDKNE